MTDFTNLATLVAQGQALLDLVKGGHITQLEADSAAKLGEVDAALALKIAQANTAIANAVAPIEGKIPTVVLTKNQHLAISSGTVPDDVYMSIGVSSTLIETVDWVPDDRAQSAKDLMSLIGADIKEQFADFDVREGNYYSKSFNIIRIDWDFPESGGYKPVLRLRDLFTDNTIVNAKSSCFAAFIKLVSGGVTGHLSGTAVEQGKWRFCKRDLVVDAFGGYVHPEIAVSSLVGSMFICLPVFVTGTINHPNTILNNVRP
jgi:hypothetical protein